MFKLVNRSKFWISVTLHLSRWNLARKSRTQVGCCTDNFSIIMKGCGNESPKEVANLDKFAISLMEGLACGHFIMLSFTLNGEGVGTGTLKQFVLNLQALWSAVFF